MAAIEVFADVACPFAHAGLQALTERRLELGLVDVAVVVRAWPLELVNGKPLSARATATHARDLRDQAFPALFAAADHFEMPASSLPAMELAAAAYRCDRTVGEEVSLALRRTFFEDGQDISRPEVLGTLADRYGVATSAQDRRAVMADWRLGESRGVQGSPHFFVGDRGWFCPSVEITPTEGGHVRVVRRGEIVDLVLRAGAG
ncbi:MAG TPA: DsbA family protein [Acidimicrobiales bacterium]|nr:DsbA family protein [Acidimicrobiales bacterium]